MESPASSPKVFISVDAEGLPYVVLPQLTPKAPLFGELRRVATRLTRVAAERLRELGYTVVVADSHGLMVNIDPFELPGDIVLVRGFPRVLSMVSGSRGASYALFIGYHARAGLDSILSHTYSGSVVYRVTVNGVEASEYLLNSLLLGEWGVPVGLVAGAAELGEEVEKHTPWAVFIPLVESVGYAASASRSLVEAEARLVAGIEEAEERRRRGVLEPLKPTTPTRLCVEFMSPVYAEAASLIPTAVRVSGREVCIEADSMEEAYRAMEAMVYLGHWARSVLVEQAR